MSLAEASGRLAASWQPHPKPPAHPRDQLGGPLDPAYPALRLARILETAAPPVLVTRRRLSGELPSRPGTRAVLLEELPASRAASPSRLLGLLLRRRRKSFV
jgi:non-ribosomal peptide synthetase component F